MFRTLPPGGVHAIDTLHKENRKKGEEQAGNLQPQNAAGVGKRAQDGLAKGLGPPLGGYGLADAGGLNVWALLPDGYLRR